MLTLRVALLQAACRAIGSRGSCRRRRGRRRTPPGGASVRALDVRAGAAGAVRIDAELVQAPGEMIGVLQRHNISSLNKCGSKVMSEICFSNLKLI